MGEFFDNMFVKCDEARLRQIMQKLQINHFLRADDRDYSSIPLDEVLRAPTNFYDDGIRFHEVTDGEGLHMGLVQEDYQRMLLEPESIPEYQDLATRVPKDEVWVYMSNTSEDRIYFATYRLKRDDLEVINEVNFLS